MVFPSGLIKVSAGLATGCVGGVFCNCMFLFSANSFIASELNGGPLSES